MNDKIKNIAGMFKFPGTLIDIKENNQGNINKTYVLSYKNNDNVERFLIQKINANVFKEPYIVMDNISKITKYIDKKLKDNKDSNHKTLEVINTVDDENLYTFTNSDGEKEYYRAYRFVEDCISYDNFKEDKDALLIAYNTGRAFGFFQKLLNEFPIDELCDTIPNFHNTPKRFDDLLESIENDVKGRALELAHETVDIMTKIKQCSVIMNKLGKSIPWRVCHNDTKVNNVLIDANTKDAIAVIDLDTVMPGSGLFDVGDGIRSAASKIIEDDPDYENAVIEMPIVKEYLRGYLEEMYIYLTKDEVKYMAMSIKIMIAELCIRFLTDYLNGDTYFKIKFKEHNKVRFLNQYHLLLDVEKHLPEIDLFVKNTYKDLMNK